jgi:hypothetical protein
VRRGGFLRLGGPFALGRVFGGSGLLTRPALRVRALGRLCATSGLTCGLRLRGLCPGLCSFASFLDTFLDRGSRRGPVLETFDRGNARKTVPDGHQALPRPTDGQFCQFLLTGEVIKRRGAGGGGLLRGAMRRDVICPCLS